MFFMTMIALPSTTAAQDKGFGLGVIFGEPTGISGKYWVNARNSINGGVAWSFHGDGFLHLHADFVWHFPDAIKADIRLPLYVGVGGRIRFDDPARVGVRIPLGIEWWVDDAPIGVFLEVVPVLDLTPSTKFAVNGGVGVRYFF
jgi:hypothetical protein